MEKSKGTNHQFFVFYVTLHVLSVGRAITSKQLIRREHNTSGSYTNSITMKNIFTVIAARYKVTIRTSKDSTS
jgi:hypothetical protein